MIQNSFIIAQDCTLFQIKKAIRQWINNYDNSLLENFCIEIYQYDTNKYIIVPKEDIDNQLFNFLVNYLYYPENIKYKPKINGYTIVKDTTIFPKEKLNYEIEIFIPEDDTEYDNVYAVTQYNEVYKIDFGGETYKSSLSRSFEKPLLDLTILSSPQILKRKKIDPKKLEEKEKEKIPKRIGIISIILAIILLIGFIIRGNPEIFSMINLGMLFCIWVWFHSDYKMLQHRTYFIIAAAIAIFLVLYYYMFIQQFLPFNKLVKSATFLPISVLLIQLPLRKIFKVILKREPIVDNPAPSIPDFIYIMLLWITSLIIPLLILIKQNAP